MNEINAQDMDITRAPCDGTEHTRYGSQDFSNRQKDKRDKRKTNNNYLSNIKLYLEKSKKTPNIVQLTNIMSY